MIIVPKTYEEVVGMRIKQLLSAAIATVCIAGLAACGSGQAETGVTDTKANKGLSTIGTTVKYNPNHLVNGGKPITIDYWTWNGTGDTALPSFKKYSKIHPNVTIKRHDATWDDYFTKLPLQLQGKNGPALFAVHNSYDSVLSPYMAAYDIPVKDLQKDYIGVKQHVKDGKIYYIDSIINTGIWYYNTDLWKKAGLTDSDIPKTWDDMRVVAKKLTKTNASGKIVQAGINFNGTGEYNAMWQGMNYQQGVLLFKKDGTTVNYNNAATKKTLNMIKAFYEEDKSGSANFGTDAQKSFGNGQTAMIYQWGHFAIDLKQKYPKIKWGQFAPPLVTKGTTPMAYDRYNGESTPGINKNARPDQQAVAQDIMKYLLASDDLCKTTALNFGSVPAKRTLDSDKQIQAMPAYKVIHPIVNRLIWPGPVPSTLESTSQKVFENIFYNKKSINEAVASGQQTMQTDLNNLSSKFTSLESQYKYFDEAKSE